jgi:hypothetical protein
VYHTGMPPSASSVYTRIADAVTTLIVLIERLEAEVPEKAAHPYGSGGLTPRGGHGPLSSWNTQAAMLVLEMHAGLRELEQDLKYQVSGHIRTRGGSDANTSLALEGLPGLVAGLDYAGAMIVTRKLEGWAFRARLILGDIEPFSRLPRLPGEKAPACPYCKTPDSLRYRPFSGQVRCIKPSCRDTNGEPPAGRLEVGAYSGEASLAWADGMTGVVSVC